MNGKVFVGQKALTFNKIGEYAPVTGVRLWADDENVYESGNDTGTVIEADCPYATQEMADNILSNISGYQYKPLTADGAIISPISELGDGLTVGDTYTQLAYENIRFSTGNVVDVAAPGSSEVDHEYKIDGPLTEEFNHKLAQTRSLIEKTAEEIRLAVENEIDGLSSSITIQLDSITSEITGIDGQISSITQTVGSINSQITGINGEISSLEQTASSLTSQIQGLNGDVSSIEQKVDNITLDVSNDTDQSYISLYVGGVEVSSKTIRFTGDVVFESDLEDGTTLISGDCIRTGEITADYIHLGGQMNVYKTASGNTMGGYIGYMSGMTASGSSTAGIAITDTTESAVVICTNAGARMGYDGVNTVVCSSTQVTIDGDTVFINGVAQSSDKRLKTDIKYDVEDYLCVFDKLKPATFIYKDHKRRHMGFIAQEIQEILKEENIPESNFAALCTEVANEERPIGMYSLRYGELQIMTVAKVQELNRRLSELEAKMNG